MTNDGNAILRDIQVQHPAAKSMIEISRTQDEEVGDGTTSVIVLAGQLLANAVPLLEQNMHPTVIIAAYRQALEDAVDILKNKVARPVNVDDVAQMTEVINSCIGTKFMSKWGALACEMALKAVKTVCINRNGSKDIDTKNYVKVRGERSLFLFPFFNRSILRILLLLSEIATSPGLASALLLLFNFFFFFLGRKSARRSDRRLDGARRRHAEQGRRARPDASNDRKATHRPARLQPRIQEGRIPDEHRDHERDRLFEDSRNRREVHPTDVRRHHRRQAGPRHHRER